MAIPEEATRGPETDPRPFSVLFAPTTVLKVDDGSVFVRHLPLSYEDEAPMKASIHPRLSSVVIVVKAQGHVLHFFRGRRLSRVVEFPSPIVDVAGLPQGASYVMRRGPTHSSVLCLVVCRNGTAYALPIAEILGATHGTRNGPASKDEPKRGSNSTALETTPHKKSRLSRASEPLGLFDDLAPTLMDGDRICPPSQRKTEDKPSGANGGADDGIISNRIANTGYHVRFVVRAQEQWAIFDHLGARIVAVCDKGITAAVAGIVDPASLYHLIRKPGENENHAGQCFGTLSSVDGATPLSSCVVWMGDGGSGEDPPSVNYSTWGNGKGFSLNPQVFRAMFGPELARLGDSTLGSQPAQSACLPSKPAVFIVGDEAGVVRWSPVPPHPVVPGGVLVKLGKAIVGTLPQLEGACLDASGLLIVSADGTVFNITAVGTSCDVDKERVRPKGEPGGQVDGSVTSPSCEGASPENTGTDGALDACFICTRTLKTPFPIASPCSVPGFLLHCHAGALFASALPKWGGTNDEIGDVGGSREGGRTLSTRQGDGNKLLPASRAPTGALDVANSGSVRVPLRPVRIPLPCETIAIAAAPVLAEGGSGKPSADKAPVIPQMLIICLSRRGKLVGFMAPRSTDELEGWGLDSGKGGVRVGGSAGVERRVRCQLERLSNVGRQCAVLSAESAERDQEIRVLRGATGLLPTLAADAARRLAPEKQAVESPNHEGLSILGHSLSIAADASENADDRFEFNTMRQAEALRVRLSTRLWVKERDRARELPTAGEEGYGRWFIVTRVLSETREYENGTAKGEGWAWSSSTPVSMTTLRQGRAQIFSVSLSLPSPEPVTVSSWLQFRFREKSDDGKNGEILHHIDPGGCCVELGSSRFDVLDWGFVLPSAPSSAAGVREAVLGRGACFCGPDLSIAEILEGPLSSTDGRASYRHEASLAVARTTLPAEWGKFEIRVVSCYRDAGTLLWMLLNARNAAPADLRDALKEGRNASAEIALRVAGQVVVLRARELGIGGGTAGDGRDSAQEMGTFLGDFEIVVVCSHEAMAPVVREALLWRSRVLAFPLGVEGDAAHRGGGGSLCRDDLDRVRIMAQADAAVRLTREVHVVGKAIANANDAASALGVARAKDGPSVETTTEALELMSRIGGVYQELRRQQERVGAVV